MRRVVCVVGILGWIVACGSSDDSAGQPGTGGTSGTAGAAATGGSSASGGSSGSGGGSATGGGAGAAGADAGSVSCTDVANHCSSDLIDVYCFGAQQCNTVRPDAVEPFIACLFDKCSVKDCLASVSATLTPSAAWQTFLPQCSAKAQTCFAQDAGFSSDLCVLDLASDEFLAAISPCLQQPCDQFQSCRFDAEKNWLVACAADGGSSDGGT